MLYSTLFLIMQGCAIGYIVNYPTESTATIIAYFVINSVLVVAYGSIKVHASQQ